MLALFIIIIELIKGLISIFKRTLMHENMYYLDTV